MKLPDFKSIDWKMLLLEKGQYGLVGLGAVIGGSLLFYSLASGVTAPSPSSNEEKLAKENARVKAAQAAATPDKTNTGPDPDVPPPKVDMLFSAGKPIDALAYMAGEPLLIPEDPAEIKRKMPKIMMPVESKVAFARVPLRSASFNETFDQVLIIGDASGGSSGPGGGPGGGIPGGMGAGSGPGGGGIRGGMPGGMGGMGGGMGAPFGGNQLLSQYSSRAAKLKDRYEEDPRKSLGSSMRNVGELLEGKLGNAKIAEQALPLRMAVIAASFPYQAQLKEFQRKLKLPNIQSVLMETSGNLDPVSKQLLPGFRFLRVELQRRTQQADGSFGEWTPIDLEESFGKYVDYTMNRKEDEDQIMGLISFPGLVMPKLLTFYSNSDTHIPNMANAGGPGGGPKGGAGEGGITKQGGVQGAAKAPGLAGQPPLYPEPEKGLEKINKMLSEYKDRKQQYIDNLYRTKPKYSTKGNRDIFSPGGAASSGGIGGGAPGMGDDAMNMMGAGAGGFGGAMGGRQGGFPAGGPAGGFPSGGPGGGFPGGMFGGVPGGMPGGMPGGLPGGGAGGFKGGFPGGSAPGGSGSYGAPGFGGGPGQLNPNLTAADLPTVEYALIRVFDPTVQPGETYQYKMRIVMSNPNFGRQDVASTSYAKEKEIVGEEWYQVPGSFSAPSDLSCYVNENRASDPNRLNLDVYKWAAAIKKDSTNIFLGDWLKSTISVGKGEMVGRNSRVTLVPYWRYDVDGYSFVPVERSGGPNSKKGVDVEFKPNLGEQGDYLLVDFDGPNARYEKIIFKDDTGVRTSVTDDHLGVEAVLQGADRRLILRSSSTDKDDQEKKTLDQLIERHKTISQASIAEAKMGNRGRNGPGGGGGAGGGDGGR